MIRRPRITSIWKVAILSLLFVVPALTAAMSNQARGEDGRPTTTPDELVAKLVKEDLSRSFQMHVISRTSAVQAGRALLKMGDDAVPALASGLESKDELQRLNIVYLLNRIGTAATVPPRLKAAGDQSARVRAATVRRLPVWSDDVSRKAVIKALKDQDAMVGNAAAAAFAIHRDGPRPTKIPGNALKYSVARLIVPLLSDPQTRYQAAETLGSIGMNVAAQPLAKVLDDERWMVRTTILEALADLNDKQVTMHVVASLRDDNANVRSYAAAALGQLSDIRAVPALMHSLTDPESSVRRSAAGALGRIGDRRAVPPLIQSLSDSSDHVVAAAGEALGRIGDPAAIKPLIGVLRPGGPAGESIAAALGQFHDPVAVEPLRLYLVGRPESRRAAEALAGIPHPDAVAALIQVSIERNSHQSKLALAPLIGHSFRSRSPRHIAQWWRAHHAEYFPPGTQPASGFRVGKDPTRHRGRFLTVVPDKIAALERPEPDARHNPPKLSAEENQAIDALVDLGVACNVNEAGQVVTAHFPSHKKLPDEALAYLKPCKRLATLSLRGSQLSPKALAHIKGLTQLRGLSLSRMNLGDADLANIAGLTKLTSLNLECPDVTDEGLKHLAGMSNLYCLRLNGTKITDAGLAHLAGLSKLGYLELKNTQIGDDGLKQLAGLTEMNTLFLASTKVTDKGLDHLRDMKKLQVLNLDDTSVTDKGMAALVEYPSLRGLRCLYLNGDAITDEGIPTICQLKSLAVLDLRGTRITDASLPRFKALKSLYNLCLSGPGITEEAVNTLRKDLRRQAVVYESTHPKQRSEAPADQK